MKLFTCVSEPERLEPRRWLLPLALAGLVFGGLLGAFVQRVSVGSVPQVSAGR